MIYVDIDTERVAISRHSYTNLNEYRLILKNNLTGNETVFNGLVDMREFERLYVFEIDMSGLVDGEYNYYLYGNDEVLETGLLQYGNYKKEVISYENNTNIKEYRG